MKQGSSISGLNTAVTLWASAAVGALAGGGLYLVAVGGTAAVMVANVGLRPLARLLDRGHALVREQMAAEYAFEVHCPAAHRVRIRAPVSEAVHRRPFTVLSIGAVDLVESTSVVITARLRSAVRKDHELEHAIASVIPDPVVTSVRWSATEVATED